MKRVRHSSSGHRLTEFRHKHQLTQAEFAALIDVSHSRISQYENGGAIPRPAVMQRIIDVTKGFVKAKNFYE